MEEKIKVLIADDNTEFSEILKRYLDKYDYIQVLGIANDGINAIEMIKSMMPDLVILDVIMPNLDGIGVLEKISEMGLKPRPLFIMLSAIGQDVFVHKAVSLGAEYYIIKPFSVDILAARIKQIYSEKHLSPFSDSKVAYKTSLKGNQRPKTQKSIESGVTDLMRAIGIPPHMLGYHYIREAVIQTINNKDFFISVTKVLYPGVAKKFKTSPQRVERAIRNAIESACLKLGPDHIASLLDFKSKNDKDKPTNSEFILLMADRVKSELGLE